VYRLLIKTHKITGLKYLCQTEREDYIGYIGSGFYWKRHLKKHGRQLLITEIIGEYQTREELKEAGLHYSELWDIVKSEEWANLIPESGSGGDTSMSENYQKGMDNRRDYVGKNNPMYGKRGEANPNFSQKRGRNPKMSEAKKKNWTDEEYRKKATERVQGSKNPAAQKCKVDGIIFDCLQDAAIYFGYEKQSRVHNYYYLRKNHKVVII